MHDIRSEWNKLQAKSKARMHIKEKIAQLFQEARTVSILGFGMEGQSSYHTIKAFLPHLRIHVCDLDTAIIKQPDTNTSWFLGTNYLDGLAEADVIIKSPGIPFRIFESRRIPGRITSQTDLFIRLFREQIIGITGTKGKSTTSCLLHHIFQQAGRSTLLAGNIGIPPFKLIPEVGHDTRIVYEMSSHQLEHLRVSPHIAIFLNMYQEHLDHYQSFEHYKQAKLNIVRWQREHDVSLYDASSQLLQSMIHSIQTAAKTIPLNIKTDKTDHGYFKGDDLIVMYQGRQHKVKRLKKMNHLMGDHNLLNVAAAASAALLHDISPECIAQAVDCFKGLPHRLELAGHYKGIDFYNDSISTIPESTIAAIRSLPKTAAIILGGVDRGIDYSHLIDFMGQSSIRTIVFTGKAGEQMHSMALLNDNYTKKKLIFESQFDDAVNAAAQACRSGDICLLSPAAASYDAFKNFMERGNRFKQLVKELSDQSLNN